MNKVCISTTQIRHVNIGVFVIWPNNLYDWTSILKQSIIHQSDGQRPINLPTLVRCGWASF